MTREARLAKGRESSRRLRSDPAYRARELERNRQYERRNRAQILPGKRVAQRRRYRENPETRKMMIMAQRRSYQKLRAQLFAGYGDACACCGETTPSFLELDHVNGGGAKHYHATGPIRLYRDVILAGFPPIYRLLCANCNRGRQRNGGICPHREQLSEAV